MHVTNEKLEAALALIALDEILDYRRNMTPLQLANAVILADVLARIVGNEMHMISREDIFNHLLCKYNVGQG